MEVAGVNLLWDADWHDGPVSGLADYQGKQYWYEAVWDAERDEYEDPRRYVLLELTQAELNEEWDWHRRFEQHVSTLHCHHAEAPLPELRPQSEHPRFYEPYKDREGREYRNRPSVAEFRL
jgi:hypothetical protein